MPRLLDQLRQKGAQIPIFSTNKTGIKRKEDEFRQSLSNGPQPRDVHVLALDEIEDSVLHPCEVCMLQKIEAAGSGTVPAAVVPWKADGQTAAQRPRAKQSKPASSFLLAPPRSPRCNPWDFSFPVLPFDAAALALFCFACPQMSQLVPA